MPSDLTLTLLSAAIVLLFVSRLAAGIVAGLACVNQALIVVASVRSTKSSFDQDDFDGSR